MKYYTGLIEEVLLEAYKNASMRVSFPKNGHPRFGQYLLANRPDKASEILPLTFFPAFDPSSEDPGNQFLLSGPLPEDWEPGMQLSIRGPIGSPFAIPKGNQRLALHAMQGNSSRLLALLNEKLSREIAIVLISDNVPQGLPAEIEIRPPKHFKEILEWCDFLILDIQLENFESYIEELESLEIALRAKGSLLISGAYPCGALADCGLCNLEIKQKEMLACKHGPLFPLSDFLS